MATAAECSKLSQMQCVFILALGRTGSTHLLRLLNSIPGYRISGETDNAWIHMGWFAHTLQLQAQAQARARGRRQPGGALSAADEGNLTLCAVRRLMLQVHNPSPHARVFGFKEIYSPFVPRPTLLGEVGLEPSCGGAGSQHASCPFGWTYADGSCFRLYGDDGFVSPPLPWAAFADRWRERLGGLCTTSGAPSRGRTGSPHRPLPSLL